MTDFGPLLSHPRVLSIPFSREVSLHNEGVRSPSGLLANCESAGLRNQPWGKRVPEIGATTGGEIGQGILLLLSTRGQDGEHTLHKATAALTGCTLTEVIFISNNAHN